MNESTGKPDNPPSPEGVASPANGSSPVTDKAQSGETRVDVAGQWQLMWWRFRKHKLALVSGVLVILIYLIAAFAE